MGKVQILVIENVKKQDATIPVAHVVIEYDEIKSYKIVKRLNSYLRGMEKDIKALNRNPKDKCYYVVYKPFKDLEHVEFLGWFEYLGKVFGYSFNPESRQTKEKLWTRHVIKALQNME